MCLIIDSKSFSEGVSIFGVREVHLVNPSITYALHLQRIGRVFRSCRTVREFKVNKNGEPVLRNGKPVTKKHEIKIFQWICRSDEILTADENAFEVLQKSQRDFAEEMKPFEDAAIDKGLYDKWNKVRTGEEDLCECPPAQSDSDDDEEKKKEEKCADDECRRKRNRECMKEQGFDKRHKAWRRENDQRKQQDEEERKRAAVRQKEIALANEARNRRLIARGRGHVK